MATQQTGSTSKRALINKANSTIVIMVSVAAAITVFSLVATKTLVSQGNYQKRVIDAKKEALSTLQQDLDNVKELKTSYDAFVSTSQNAIGGNTGGIGSQDGDNANIILDALPSQYNFPALTTNIESLLNASGVQPDSISGTDDEIAQAENTSSSDPEPVEIPFSIQFTSDYEGVKRVISSYERSIRPFKITSFDLSGGSDSSLRVSIDALTYYQPAKSLQIQSEVIE